MILVATVYNAVKQFTTSKTVGDAVRTEIKQPTFKLKQDNAIPMQSESGLSNGNNPAFVASASHVSDAYENEDTHNKAHANGYTDANGVSTHTYIELQDDVMNKNNNANGSKECLEENKSKPGISFHNVNNA